MAMSMSRVDAKVLSQRMAVGFAFTKVVRVVVVYVWGRAPGVTACSCEQREGLIDVAARLVVSPTKRTKRTQVVRMGCSISV